MVHKSYQYDIIILDFLHLTVNSFIYLVDVPENKKTSTEGKPESSQKKNKNKKKS